MKKREPIQKFDPLQALIATVTVGALSVGIYLFLAKTESKTFFGEFLHEMVLTKEQLKKEKDAKFEKEAAAAFEDDDF